MLTSKILSMLEPAERAYAQEIINLFRLKYKRINEMEGQVNALSLLLERELLELDDIKTKEKDFLDRMSEKYAHSSGEVADHIATVLTEKP